MNDSPHQPVLYKEIIHAWLPRRGGRYVDGTLGAGGHARGILEASAPDGQLLGLDVDPQALALARKILAPYEQRIHLAQASYTTLERKVEERTQQLQAANLSKSRFLAAASHDLRQPLHALNLFAAQLRSEKDQAERDRLAVRIDTAVANMNELFNALLDISKLDAGALQANVSEFPVSRVLNRMAATFTQVAQD